MMKCPKCDEEMEYEEIKYSCGEFHCECGAVYSGEWFPVAGDEHGNITDHEEKLYEEVKNEETKEENRNT